MKGLKERIEERISREAVRPKNGHEGTTRYYCEEYQAGAHSLLPLLLELAQTLASLDCQILPDLQGDLNMHAANFCIKCQALAKLEQWAAEGSRE